MVPRAHGVPTASEFATVMAKGKCGEDSKTRRTYMLQARWRAWTGEPMESFINAHMERGAVMEDEALGLQPVDRRRSGARRLLWSTAFKAMQPPIRLSATAARSKSRPNFLIC